MKNVAEAIVLAALVGLVAGCGSNNPSPSTNQVTGTSTTSVAAPPRTTVAPPPPVGMNEEVVDGTFAFKVTAVTTEPTWEGESLPPQGIYVYVIMHVTNIGKTSQTYHADYQRLVDGEEREYSPAISAMKSHLVPSATTPIDINPGNSPVAALFFDVPKGTQPSQYVLLLRASPDSSGVTVALK
jgi:hypothetical protein